MNFDKAIKSGLLMSTRPLSAEEITDVIIKKNLVIKHKGLLSKVNDYLSSTKSKQFIKLGSQTNLYIPARNKINQLLNSVKSLSPHSKAIKILNDIDVNNISVSDLQNYSDPRIRYILFLELRSKNLGIKTFVTLINVALADSNINVKALGLIYLDAYNLYSNRYGFDTGSIVDMIDNKYLFKYAISHLSWILYVDNPEGIQKKVASLLLNNNQKIVSSAVNFIFTKKHYKGISLLFHILENWTRYKKGVMRRGISRDDIIDHIEKFSNNQQVLNDDTMIEYCNSTNLEIKLLAIKFMHNKWRRISSIGRIKKRIKNTNSHIRFYILKSYNEKHSINKIRTYAKKYIYDNDPYLKNYAVQSLVEVGEDDDLKCLQDIAKSDYSGQNYSKDFLLEAIVSLRSKLGK